MANSLTSLIPEYWKRTIDERDVREFFRKPFELERIQEPMPWEFKLARVCEALIVAGAIALIILATWL